MGGYLTHAGELHRGRLQARIPTLNRSGLGAGGAVLVLHPDSWQPGPWRRLYQWPRLACSCCMP